MTLWRDLREAAVDALRAAGVHDPDQELRWIVEQASGRSAAEQVGALDDHVTERELGQVMQMVDRRAVGEPLQYVLGRWGFRSLDLFVDRRVLIPRPETEVVAGLAIDALEHRERSVVADLGTGSGAIALSLAVELWPRVEVWGTDASSDALAVARANVAALGRRGAVVRLVEGDWFGALPDELRGRLDLIVSNPPYVAVGESLPDAVARWEPSDALLAGPDGLTEVRRIVAAAPDWLADDGVLVVEIGETQGSAVLDLAGAAGFAAAAVERDLAGRDRVLVARVRAGGRAS